VSTVSINGSTPVGTGASSEFRWRGAQALGRVYALNERCIELLCQLSRTERERTILAIINQHRILWRGLSTTARRYAASMPFLLVDARFQDADWWRWAKVPRAGRMRKMGPQAAFSGKVAGELMREALMLAWSTVGIDRGAASVLLGMTPAVSSLIGDLSPQDVERIAASNSRYLRPRWEDFPVFWGKLLTAARDADEGALHEVRLHGIQLLGSELLPLLDGRSK
jgi:hypothetical protein